MSSTQSNILLLQQSNFKSTIEAHALVIVDFWAEWCEPCMRFMPTYDAVATEYPHIVFAKVNIEESPEIAGFFDVKKIPALLVIKDRVVIDNVEGLMKAHEFAHHIQMWLAFDMAGINAHFDAKALLK